MDFHRMKRKELQALCKRHGIPANLTNCEMVDRLASIYKENEKFISLEKLSTNSEEIGSENKAKVKKQAKKVRFSPENQTFEYEVSVYLRPTRSRKPLLSKYPAQAIDNVPNCEDARKAEDCQVRVTRSRVQNAVAEDVNLVFSPPIGRKRRRGGMKNKDAEVNNIGKSEMSKMGTREDVKNGHDKVTGGLTGRQLRSRKNVNEEESTIRKGKGADVVHLFHKISEETDVVREDAKTKNGRKQPTRNARKEDQSVKLSSEPEKVEVAVRVTRQSRVQSKDIASTVKSEIKTVGVEGGCEEVLQLKEPQKGKRKNAVPQRVSGESSLIAIESSAAEKPLRRSKRNAEKNCAKSGTSVRSETQVTKVQEQSESDIAFEEPPECLRRFSSRRKSSGKGGNKERFSKRSRTTELDAIVERSGEIERAKYAQDQAPFRRSKRKSVNINPPALIGSESGKMEDIDKMQQFGAPYLVRDITEELPKKSSQNSSRCSSSGTSKGQTAVAERNQGVKQQMQEPSLEEEKTSVIDHHPVTEKPQRRSNRITSIRASISPCSPTAKVVEKRQPSYFKIEIIEDEAALTEILTAPGELPTGKDELVVTEDSGNKNDLDLNCSNQAVKNANGCSNKKRKGLRGNSGSKKQCGFVEASPLFLDMEEFKDSVGNMEESLITTSENFQQQSTLNSMVVEEENNLVGDDKERLVHDDNVESEVNCMRSQSINTTCVLDDANRSEPKLRELESNVSHVVDSTEINFLAESQVAGPEIAVNIAGCGICDQEIEEDLKPIDTYSAHESSVVYKKDRSRVNDKQRLIQVDSPDTEMNNPQSNWSLNDCNLLESRQVESESNVINMDSSEMTSLPNGLSLADQRDLTGATCTLLNLEKELEAEPPTGENPNFLSDNVNAGDGRTSFGEAHILVILKDTDFTAAESMREAILKDSPNDFGETSGLEGGPENTPKKAEEMNASDFSNREGIPHMESSVKATENQGSSVEFHFATAETGARKIIELQKSSCSNTAAPETPCGPAPENLFKDKICRVKAADTIGIGRSDQERSEDLNPVNAHFILESVLTHAENTGVVEEATRIHDEIFQGELKYQSCLSLNRTGAIDDSNLVEPRMVDFESKGSKVVTRGITSLANVFSSASQADLAGKTSSHIDLEKVLQTGEPSESMNSIYHKMDVEGSRTPIEEDQIQVQLKDANVTADDSIGEVIFNDLLIELGETIGFNRGSEIPLKKFEKLSAPECSDGGVALTESSINATEKNEYRAQIDTAMTCTPNITEIKWSSSSGTATSEAVSAQQSQDKLCNAGNTVSIARSEICNQDEETSLVEHDKEILIQQDTTEGEIKYQSCLSSNKTGALDDALVETRMVDLESNANKVICSEMTFLVDVCSSASQANFAGETSNESKLVKVSESEESPRRENNYESNNNEVEDGKSPAQEEQNSMQLEDACTNAAELVQEVVSQDHLNELCESCGTKEFVISLKKAEETSSDHFFGKGIVQTGSSVDINEKSEATVKIHTLAAETGEKTIMEMNWRESSHDTTLISPLRLEVGSQDLQGTIYKVETAVSNAGYGVCDHQENEENVKIEENEHDETINNEKDLLFSGKEILEESFEGNFLVGGVCRGLSNSTGRQCAKDKKVDISEGSFYNVSGETEEKQISEVLAEEGTDPVSSEGKDNYIFETASHDDVSPQRICINKLSLNGCLPVSNDMQENSVVLYMDNKNIRKEVDAYFLQLDNESEAAKQGAENGEANAMAISNATQALPSEDLTTPIISEPFSMRPHDHALVDRVRNSSGERVNKDYAATMDSIGISASRGIDVGQDDNIMEEKEMSSLKVVLAHHSGCTEFSEEIENAATGTRVSFVKANYGDVDDQGEEFALQRVCSSSIGLDGPKSTDGIIVESTLNSISNDPQSGRKVDDPDVNDSSAANEFDAALTVEEAGLDDGRKAPISHQSPLHGGGTQEDVPSNADKPCMGSSTFLCSTIPVSREKEINPQVLDDMNDVGGSEISIDCKVTRVERDGFQMNTGGFVDETDVSLVEISEAKSDDCDGSVKTATFLVNQPLCLDESKNNDLENEEPHALHLHSREVRICDKLDIVSSMKPKMVTDCSCFPSVYATSDEHNYLENPDESDVLDNMEMSLFLGVEDEVKTPDANAGDGNHSALDKTIAECNSSNLKEEDYVASCDVEDINFSEETMELRKDEPGLIAAMAEKSPLTKNSDVVEREEAFRAELNLLSSQKKNTTAKSNIASVKQFSSSIMKRIQTTPKRLMIHDMKENELSTKSKRKQIGNRKTPKTSSKRLPLEPVWKY